MFVEDTFQIKAQQVAIRVTFTHRFEYKGRVAVLVMGEEAVGADVDEIVTLSLNGQTYNESDGPFKDHFVAAALKAMDFFSQAGRNSHDILSFPLLGEFILKRLEFLAEQEDA
ncbi:MAG: hypothetical protein V4757_06775 [Pseudomonadota bacterium]